MKGLRWLVMGSVVAMIAGCGGGSNGGNNGGGGGGGENPTAVTVKITGGAPQAVAAKIGSGAFAAQTVSGGAVSLSIPAGTTTFALAVNCPSYSETAGANTLVYYHQVVAEASTADGTSFTIPCPTSPLAPTTGQLAVSLDASAVSGANAVAVIASNGTVPGEESFQDGASATFSAAMPAGSDRVGAAGYVKTASNQFGANTVYTLAALRNFDGVTVPGSLNGGAAVTLGTADAVSTQPIAYQNPPAGYSAPVTIAFYEWKNGGAVLLSNEAASTYPMVPSAAAESGDQYSFLTYATAGGSLGHSVIVLSTSTSGGPQTFSFPAPWSYAGPSPAALPSFDMTYSGFAGKTGVIDIAGISWALVGSQPATTYTNYSYQVFASAKFLNGSSTLLLPDLSPVPGFLTPPSSGTQVAWLAQVTQSDSGFLTGASAISNTAVQSAGVFNVP